MKHTILFHILQMFFILFTASGEPPMCMSCSVLFAVKKAIESARTEINNKDFSALCELNTGNGTCTP